MKAVIFHGWKGHAQENWIPWLRSSLEEKGYQVTVPSLPDPAHPDQETWIKAASMAAQIDRDTVLIGHSLGSVLILRLLERKGSAPASCFLVSGFQSSLGIKEIAGFFKVGFDWGKIRTASPSITLINAKDDPYIPVSEPLAIQAALGCRLILEDSGGHFNAESGYTRFPLLLETIGETRKINRDSSKGF